MCVCVCVYVCVYTDIHILYIGKCKCVYMYIYVYVNVYTCIHVSICRSSGEEWVDLIDFYISNFLMTSIGVMQVSFAI